MLELMQSRSTFQNSRRFFFHYPVKKERKKSSNDDVDCIGLD